MTDLFLNGRVELHCGDCRDVLATLPECSVDSVVTDPPYHLTSIVKRFGGNGAAPAQYGKDGAYARASAGFMGKVWDGGDIAFKPETWAEVLRVLKPGGHLLAFGGTRTFARMSVAIEDAGFEIRDTIMWVYGSGFPKSHDVSKGIDRAANRVDWFGPWLRTEREKRGVSQKELAERGGFYGTVNHGGLVANWETGYGTPSVAEFNKVCEILNLPFSRIEEVEREVVGQRKVNKGVAFTSDGPDSLDVTISATPEAAQWEGWGTALKPAVEPIVLARKPLSEGTVAANVLKWGTGAINVGACRVGEREKPKITNPKHGGHEHNCYGAPSGGGKLLPPGRWPANLIHDGSEEVVAAFPETQSGYSDGTKSGIQQNCFGKYGAGTFNETYGDSGSAARFFYSAKADGDDRLGSKHPTVKPVDLMQYLVRLVTPSAGTVLDPFCGTGTTGEAAWREGMRAILIEAETEYQADVRRRMALALAGPDEKAHAIIKAKGLTETPGPLFDWGGDYDAHRDVEGSFSEAYRAIRERKAAGGPGWEPK